MSRRKYKVFNGHKAIYRARQGENTATTHKATKLQSVYIDTIKGKKYKTFLTNLEKKYTGDFNLLVYKEEFNENAVAKFQNRTEDSRMTSSLNNMAFNCGEQYPPILITEKMKIKINNLGLHWKRGGSPKFAIPFLCWYYSEGYLEKPLGFPNMKCFEVNIMENSEAIIKLFNKGYTLIETKISKFELSKETIQDLQIGQDSIRYVNYIQAKEHSGGNYDSTYFCNIRYNRYTRKIEEVDKWGATSLGNNLSYTLEQWTKCIKKGEIRPEFYFIGNEKKVGMPTKKIGGINLIE